MSLPISGIFPLPSDSSPSEATFRYDKQVDEVSYQSRIKKSSKLDFLLTRIKAKIIRTYLRQEFFERAGSLEIFQLVRNHDPEIIVRASDLHAVKSFLNFTLATRRF